MAQGVNSQHFDTWNQQVNMYVPDAQFSADNDYVTGEYRADYVVVTSSLRAIVISWVRLGVSFRSSHLLLLQTSLPFKVATIWGSLFARRLHSTVRQRLIR